MRFLCTKTILAILCILLSCTPWAQKPKGYGIKVPIPYGMTAVDNSLFVDDTEISVGEWLEFYYYSIDSSRAIPNPACRPHFLSENKPTYAFLFETNANTSLCLKYKGYNNGEAYRPIPIPADSVHSKKEFNRLKKRYMGFPIAYISYEQANAYCTWRAKHYNQGKNYPLDFRLPSPEEINRWNENLDSVLITTSGTWPSGNYNDSYRRPGFCSTCGYAPVVVAMFFSFEPNLYDIQGNLAEMTLTQGVAMGGSYRHPYRASLEGHSLHYTKPEPWLGFRCVASLK